MDVTKPTVVVLVPAEKPALATGARVDGADARFEVVDGPIPTAVARARAAHHGPIALLAATDADAVEAIRAGADDALVLCASDDRAVRLLAERAQARFALRQADASERLTQAHAEKLVALGTVVAGVAHEINNPLAAMMLSIDAFSLGMSPLVTAMDELRRAAARGSALSAADVTRLAGAGRESAPVSELRDLLADFSTELQTIADVVRDLRIYARVDDAEHLTIVEVPDLIEQVLRVVGREIFARGHIERDYARDLPVLALPRSRLVQVVTNVLVNAAHAISEVDRAVHRVRVSARSDEEYVAISISDTGPGIAQESLERIFDPFYTTKRVGAGTGLGLSISRTILRELGGDLLVESVHGVGATFIALLPVSDSASLRAAVRRGSVVPGVRSRGKRPAVLVVDDDERLLRAYPRILREHFDVIVAADGQEAVDLLLSGSPADAVISDLMMPEMDGGRLFAWLMEHRPELARRTIFVTAGAATEQFADFLTRVPNQVLDKPVKRTALLEAIEAALREA